MSRVKTDPKLGQLIQKHLVEKKLETVVFAPNKDDARAELENGIGYFLSHMGLDLNDPSIKDSPVRIATMFTDELCSGLDYTNFPKCTTAPNVGADEMVMVDSINTISLCEHHFQAIVGVTHIAYLPGQKLLGLSKFARVTDFFARRPQVQERMTEQICAALQYILETEDVAVQQVCVHNCMRVRGVMDPRSKTTTSKVGGRFLSNPSLRTEFLHGIK